MQTLEHGESEITIAGRTFRLKMGTGAIIAIQERLSVPGRLVPLADIFAESSRGRVLYTRTIIWGAMRKHHPTVTDREIEDLLDQATAEEILRLRSALEGQSMPDPRDVADLQEGTVPGSGPSPFPRRATIGDGTGEDSISTPDASASLSMTFGT
jgi:hypothetical protein